MGYSERRTGSIPAGAIICAVAVAGETRRAFGVIGSTSGVTRLTGIVAPKALKSKRIGGV